MPVVILTFVSVSVCVFINPAPTERLQIDVQSGSIPVECLSRQADYNKTDIFVPQGRAWYPRKPRISCPMRAIIKRVLDGFTAWIP